MALGKLVEEETAVRIFQESLKHNRLAHAYLIAGASSELTDAFAREVAKTLNCTEPVSPNAQGVGIDACDACQTCRQIMDSQQADVTWIRPESKTRIITIAQIRSVLETVHLKAHGARYKVIIVSGADRMNTQAANAFLKTLEEPPARSILLLLSTEPHRLLDTILSRCLRIQLSGVEEFGHDKAGIAWLQQFSQHSEGASREVGLRYHLLSDLLECLASKKTQIEEALTAASPLEQHEDLEPKLRERFKQELSAAIEAEYRRQRSELIGLLQWFLRDVWLQTLRSSQSLLRFPNLKSETQAIATRLSANNALKNLNIADGLQRQLNTNVQEALAIEVALLRLAL